MMQGPSPHVAEAAAGGGPDLPRLFNVSAVWTLSHQRDLDAVARRPCGVATILGGIFFRREIPTATPTLVADAPEADVQRLPPPPGPAPARPPRRDGRSARRG